MVNVCGATSWVAQARESPNIQKISANSEKKLLLSLPWGGRQVWIHLRYVTSSCLGCEKSTSQHPDRKCTHLPGAATLLVWLQVQDLALFSKSRCENHLAYEFKTHSTESSYVQFKVHIMHSYVEFTTQSVELTTHSIVSFYRKVTSQSAAAFHTECIVCILTKCVLHTLYVRKMQISHVYTCRLTPDECVKHLVVNKIITIFKAAFLRSTDPSTNHTASKILDSTCICLTFGETTRVWKNYPGHWGDSIIMLLIFVASSALNLISCSSRNHWDH